MIWQTENPVEVEDRFAEVVYEYDEAQRLSEADSNEPMFGTADADVRESDQAGGSENRSSVIWICFMFRIPARSGTMRTRSAAVMIQPSVRPSSW
jgi:hypothetical protein